MFPHPVFWREYYNEDCDFEDTEAYKYENIPFWSKDGEMKYSITTLLRENNIKEQKYLFFWQPN